MLTRGVILISALFILVCTLFSAFALLLSSSLSQALQGVDSTKVSFVVLHAQPITGVLWLFGIGSLLFAIGLFRRQLNLKLQHIGRCLSSDTAVSDGMFSLEAVEHFAESCRQQLDDGKIQSQNYVRQSVEASEELKTIREQFLQQNERAEENRCHDFSNSSETLNLVLGRLEQASRNLGELTGRAGQGAASQRESIGSAATAIEEMNASIAEVANNAETASSDAHTAQTNATEGQKEMLRAEQSIDMVKERTSALSQAMASLGEQATAIDQIMTVISDIADQTNLLALNAAIEAARAGEAGRGFAVVADEVRKLAEKTMSATKDVGEQISAIQNGVQTALTNTDQSLELVREASERAQHAGNSMRTIVDNTEAAAKQIGYIAQATREQSTACELVSRTVEEVNSISSATAEDMRASEEAMGIMNTQVEELAVMRQVFEQLGNGKVQKVINTLTSSAEIRSMDRAAQEKMLRETIKKHTFFELLYLTDAEGIQTIGNIAAPEMQSAQDIEALGANWSDRSWYQEPLRYKSLYITKAYVSSASGKHCITVSKPFYDDQGAVLGILAADVKL